MSIGIRKLDGIDEGNVLKSRIVSPYFSRENGRQIVGGYSGLRLWGAYGTPREFVRLFNFPGNT